MKKSFDKNRKVLRQHRIEFGKFIGQVTSLIQITLIPTPFMTAMHDYTAKTQSFRQIDTITVPTLYRRAFAEHRQLLTEKTHTRQKAR